MNLFDIIKRKDRSVEILAGACEAEITKYEGQSRRCIRFTGATKVNLKLANEFSILEDKPSNLGWQVRLGKKSFFGDKGVSLRISAESNGIQVILTKLKVVSEKNIVVELNWPAVIGNFDICIETSGGLLLDVGPNLSTRTSLLKLVNGFGVEVGPGLNPAIRPSKNVTVEYLEAMPISKWNEIYRRDPGALKEINDQGLDKFYKTGNASDIESLYEDSKLNFIFSSHVFEHLNNPLKHLEIWSKKLKKNGYVIGVIPDCRFCFDLRQKPSTKEDWLYEYQNGLFDTSDAKLERWIKFTSPSSNIESLRERNYSVHVHFYTPRTFLEMANVAKEMSLFSEVHVHTITNNKDFGFIMVK